jgi:hypothetical protein
MSPREIIAAWLADLPIGTMTCGNWADGILKALDEQGMAVVPKEPTQGMKLAALTELSDCTVDEPKAAAWDAIRAYRAMIETIRADARKNGNYG